MIGFPQQEKIFNEILKRPANSQCADCNTISPTWASLDFGVFLCSNCSGAHRALGPTITRVKSTKLDLWDPEWFKNMQIGNKQINKFWEHKVIALTKKPKLGASLQEVNRYVTDKYIKKKYAADGVDPPKQFQHSQCIHNSNGPTILLSPMDAKSETKKKEIQFLNIIQNNVNNVKKEVIIIKGDLLDFTQEIHTKPKSVGQKHKSIIQEEEQFGSFTDAATNNSQAQKDMTFEELMSLQKSKSGPEVLKGHIPTNFVSNYMQNQNNYQMANNPYTLASSHLMHNNMLMNSHQTGHNRGTYHSMSHQDMGQNIGHYGYTDFSNHMPSQHHISSYHHYHHQNLAGITGHLPINAHYPGNFQPITLSTIHTTHQQPSLQQDSWINNWK